MDTKSKIIGQSDVFSLIKRAVDNDRLAHAYLITGAKGVGKIRFAEAVAQMLLGENRTLNTQPDFIKIERGIDPKTNKARTVIAIDQIHQLRAKLTRRAMLDGWQVAIIKDAELLNASSANALLKTLEEPRDKTIILLTALDGRSVIPTIKSRCQELRLNRVSTAEIKSALLERGVTETDASILAKMADGCPERAVALADNPAELERLKKYRSAVFSLARLSLGGRWQTIESFLPKKHSFQEAQEIALEFLAVSTEVVRDALLIRNGLVERVVHSDVIYDLKDLAESELDLCLILAEVYKAKKRIASNVGPRIALDNFVLAFSPEFVAESKSGC